MRQTSSVRTRSWKPEKRAKTSRSAGGVPVHFLGDRHHRDRCNEAVMDWPRILAYVTGTVDQGLQYLATENRILKHQLKDRLMLSDAQRATLGEIGHRWVARARR